MPRLLFLKLPRTALPPAPVPVIDYAAERDELRLELARKAQYIGGLEERIADLERQLVERKALYAECRRLLGTAGDLVAERDRLIADLTRKSGAAC